MLPPTLSALRKRAKTLGVVIEATRDDTGWGYWLLDAATGDGVWPDENFCTDHFEIRDKLDLIEWQRA
jgi:hypothetical protein